MNELYIKEIDGQLVTRHINDIVVIKDGMRIFNPSVELVLEDGWAVYEQPEPEDIHINNLRQQRIDDLIRWDSSDNVNIFYLGEMPIWLDKATRVGLMLRFQSENALGKEQTTLWYDGIPVVLQLEDAIKMLYAIELYASACYDNTQKHYSNILKLNTEHDILNYDIRVGYPEKLTF